MLSLSQLLESSKQIQSQQASMVSLMCSAGALAGASQSADYYTACVIAEEICVHLEQGAAATPSLTLLIKSVR